MINNFAHRAQRATTVTTLAGIAMITGFLDRAGGTAKRRSDRGGTLEQVIIWAGVAALASRQSLTSVPLSCATSTKFSKRGIQGWIVDSLLT